MKCCSAAVSTSANKNNVQTNFETCCYPGPFEQDILCIRGRCDAPDEI